MSDHIWFDLSQEPERKITGMPQHKLCSSVVAAVRPWAATQRKKPREGEKNNTPAMFSGKIRLIWRSLKERQRPLQLRGGAWKQVQRERLRLQRCAGGTPPLSLVLFINLLHPPRASPDPHSSQREAIAFLSLLIPLHHTHTAPTSAPSAQEHTGQRTAGRRSVFHSQSKSKGRVRCSAGF